MNSQIRLIGGLAAIAVIVAVLGIILIPKPGGVSGLGPPPTPSSTPTLSASPSPTPSPTSSPTPSSSPSAISPGLLCAATTCLTGTLEAGTYSFAGGSTEAVTPTSLTFTIPSGWTTSGGYISKNAPDRAERSGTPWAERGVLRDLPDHQRLQRRLPSDQDDGQRRDDRRSTDEPAGGPEGWSSCFSPHERHPGRIPGQTDPVHGARQCRRGIVRQRSRTAPLLAGSGRNVGRRHLLQSGRFDRSRLRRQ